MITTYLGNYKIKTNLRFTGYSDKNQYNVMFLKDNGFYHIFFGEKTKLISCDYDIGLTTYILEDDINNLPQEINEELNIKEINGK